MRIRGRSRKAAADASEGSRLSVVNDYLWTAQDRTRTRLRQALGLLWAKLLFPLREQVVLPLRDRAELAGTPVRAIGVGGLVMLAAFAGVAALLWASPDHKPQEPTLAEVGAPVTQQPAPAPSKPAKPTATLHGAAPVFESGDAAEAAGTGGVEAGDDPGVAEATAKNAPNPAGAAGADEAAATKISSRPGSPTSSASTSSAPQSRPARGPVAGPAAIAVARRFANAFVSYEVGGAEDPAVHSTFASTTAPALEQALLQRPPRLPAGVRVPKAKVLNIVPAPSRNHVFPISVSLLRVGTTSELRLEMEKQKGKGWLVTNVLG